ncbi:unannotated protein [freshwater metagenome]|uniref:Unannotated protein n=1 Tax=freshwater metagenome TaxID=449393 RepID=A0A6J7KR22_9ZZZZ
MPSGLSPRPTTLLAPWAISVALPPELGMERTFSSVPRVKKNLDPSGLNAPPRNPYADEAVGLAMEVEE